MDNEEEKQKEGQKLAEGLTEMAAMMAKEINAPAVGIMICLDKTKSCLFMGSNESMLKADDMPDYVEGFAAALAKMAEEIREGKLSPKEVGHLNCLQSKVHGSKVKNTLQSMLGKIEKGGAFQPPDLDETSFAN